MSRMFNLRNILELVNDGLDNGAVAGEQLVTQAHQAVLHMAFRLGKELNAVGLKKGLSQWMRDIAPVGKDFAEQVLEQLRHGFTVIHIAWSQGEIEQFSTLIDYQMQLETKEPINRGFASGCQIRKHAMSREATIVANLEASGINKAKRAYTCRSSA